MASEDERDAGPGEAGDAESALPVGVSTPEELTILFVDDERQLLSIIASRLKSELDSLNIVTASHGTEALERLNQLDVDCIVSDYKMPGMDGLELLKRCRERDPDVPFILFTSKGSEEVATEAINADVTDYLQKNMGEQQFALLANRIENAVSEYRAKQVASEAYEHVRRIHDRVSDAYLGLDDEWRIDYVDEAGADLLNDDPESLHGESLWEVLPEAVGSPFETQFERALETGDPVDFETRYEPFDTWFQVRAFPANGGLSVYFRDITELKELRQSLEDRRERLDRVAAATDDLEAAVDDLDSDATADLRTALDDVRTALDSD
jgi:CheY-like chemotaxis protein